MAAPLSSRCCRGQGKPAAFARLGLKLQPPLPSDCIDIRSIYSCKGCMVSRYIRLRVEELLQAFLLEPKPNAAVTVLGYPNTIEESDEDIVILERLQRNISEEIYRLKRLRNSRTRIQSLPGEIFVNILLWSLDLPNWSITAVQNLALVSTYWLDTVLSTSLFWPVLDFAQGMRVAAISAKRNTSGLLAVWCSSFDTANTEPFLQNAVQHAHRWRTLVLAGEYTPNHLAVIETPASNLQDLFVFFPHGQPPRPINLPAGRHLRHVDVAMIGLHWDSDRLVGLKSLQISTLNFNIPTVSQLRLILSCSPQLRRLVLDKLWVDPALGHPVVKDDNICTPAVIHLPSLSTVCLQFVPKSYSQYLCNFLEAPTCDCLVLDNVEADWLLSSKQLSSLTALLLQQHPAICLIFSEFHQTLKIVSKPPPLLSSEWIHWGEDRPGIDITLHMPPNDLELWSSVIALVTRQATSISLHLHDSGIEIPTPHFPYQVLDDLPSIHTIKCLDNFKAGPLLRHMGTLTLGSDGHLRWPFRGLQEFSLDWYADHITMLNDLVAFVTERYPSTNRPQQSTSSNGVEPPDMLRSAARHLWPKLRLVVLNWKHLMAASRVNEKLNALRLEQVRRNRNAAGSATVPVVFEYTFNDPSLPTDPDLSNVSLDGSSSHRALPTSRRTRPSGHIAPRSWTGPGFSARNIRAATTSGASRIAKVQKNTALSSSMHGFMERYYALYQGWTHHNSVPLPPAPLADAKLLAPSLVDASIAVLLTIPDLLIEALPLLPIHLRARIARTALVRYPEIYYNIESAVDSQESSDTDDLDASFFAGVAGAELELNYFGNGQSALVVRRFLESYLDKMGKQRDLESWEDVPPTGQLTTDPFMPLASLHLVNIPLTSLINMLPLLPNTVVTLSLMSLTLPMIAGSKTTQANQGFLLRKLAQRLPLLCCLNIPHNAWMDIREQVKHVDWGRSWHHLKCICIYGTLKTDATFGRSTQPDELAPRAPDSSVRVTEDTNWAEYPANEEERTVIGLRQALKPLWESINRHRPIEEFVDVVY
ncbi:hypothetical protein FRB99_004019 [Tulasnella sp. 403]|nr:hypothetical protein FRB99_004019 [Tulasnella sp. 403]